MIVRDGADKVAYVAKAMKVTAPRRESGPVVFWELRGWVSHLKFTGQRWLLSSWIGQNMSQWSMWWRNLGLCPTDFIASEKSNNSPLKTDKRRLAECEPDACAKEFVLSLGLLVAWFIYCSIHLGSLERRSVAMGMLAELCDRCGLQKEVLDSLEPPKNDGCCKPAPGEPQDGPCRHACRLMRILEQQRGRGANIAMQLASMAKETDCEFVMAWLSNVVADIAGAIGAFVFGASG